MGTADFAVYLVLRALAAFLLGMPEFLLRGLVERAVDLGYPLDVRHRARCEGNLAAAGYSKREAGTIGRGVFRHFFTSLVESLLLHRRLTAENWSRYFRLENWSLLESALASGKGVVCVGCHQGNWEMAGYASALYGLPITTVARAFRNRRLDEFLNKGLRDTAGRRTVPQQGGVRELMHTLKDGKIGVLLADQNAGRDGLFVPFFGRPASTAATPAALAIRTDAAILPFYTYREGPFRYVFGFHPDREPARTGDSKADVLEVTRWYTSLFERSIRERPEQWIWGHRRWLSTERARTGPA